MDPTDAAMVELEEALDRLSNAVNAAAYQIERWAERLQEENDKSVSGTN